MSFVLLQNKVYLSDFSTRDSRETVRDNYRQLVTKGNIKQQQQQQQQTTKLGVKLRISDRIELQSGSYLVAIYVFLG